VLPWLPMFVWLTSLPRLHWLSKLPVSQRLLRFVVFVNLGFRGYHVSLVTGLCECARLWLSEHFLFCYCRGCRCFVFGATAPSGPGHPHSRGFWITHNDTPQSAGLLWTSDQFVAETSTWQHTTITTDTTSMPPVGFDPQSEQASGRRPSP